MNPLSQPNCSPNEHFLLRVSANFRGRLEFRTLGYSARRVRWLYHLPSQPPEVQLLGANLDVHSAVEVLIEGDWVLVDATHDPPLAGAGLVVADWDGRQDTPPAYAPLSRRWIDGQDDALVADAITNLVPTKEHLGRRYRDAFNAWLVSHR